MKKKYILVALLVLALLVGAFIVIKYVFYSNEMTGECKAQVLTQNSMLGRKGETITICP